MLPTVRDTVRMALDTIPVEHRHGIRTLIRQVTAEAWDDGRRCGQMDAHDDTRATLLDTISPLSESHVHALGAALRKPDVFAVSIIREKDTGRYAVSEHATTDTPQEATA